MKREDVRGTALELLGDAGLTILPIDVEAFAGYLDIRVYRRHDLPEPLSGLLYRGSEWDSIVVNARQGALRQRFTIAHELGHWWLDEPGTSWSFDADCEREALWEQERNVNSFAGALLMPEALLREEWERNPDREALCWRFRVSRRALALRLCELGLGREMSYEP